MAPHRLRSLAFAAAGSGLLLLASMAVSPVLAAQTAQPPDAKTMEIKLPASLLRTIPEKLEDLKEIEAHVQMIVAKVMPAVVNVKIGAQGSGVIITEDGYVLTAGHVSGQPGRECTLTFADGKQVKGKSLGQNKSADSGLIKITEEGKYPYCVMAKSSELTKGQWCVAIGHPGGLKQGRTPPVRLGHIAVPDGKFITSDCTLVGGDSGGPLFDMYGRVIGIHSRIGNPITANMHVPVDIFREEWDRLVKGESWGVATGGGKGQPSDPPKTPLARLNGVEFADGAKELKIAKIQAGSTADKTGLAAGDLVLSVNGRRVATADAFRAEIGRGPAGAAVTLEVRRGDDYLNLRAILDKIE
jgi:serine protease Do